MLQMHEYYQRERHNDFLQEAEQERLINAADNTSRKPFYKPALNALGATLVTLGNRLQDDANTMAQTPMRTANDCA